MVQTAARDCRPVFECAFLPDDRARMLVEYATGVRGMGFTGRVRQRGGLTSFHIPINSLRDPVWTKRYGPVRRSDEHKLLIIGEREALAEHARAGGCTLILTPLGVLQGKSREFCASRVQPLIDFAREMHRSGQEVRVAFAPYDEAAYPESTTLVGDWFFSQSVQGTRAQGYRNTVFTRHAATARRRVREFDQEFTDLLCHDLNREAQTTDGLLAVLAELRDGKLGRFEQLPLPAGGTGDACDWYDANTGRCTR